MPRAVRDGKLRPAAQREGSCDFSIRRVNRCRAVSTPVERKDALGGGIVENPVRPFAGLRLADFLQRLQIKDGHLRRPAVAGEAAVKFRRQRHAVHTWRVRNIAHDFISVRVQYDHVCAARNVKPPRRTVDRQVIPSAFASEMNLLNQAVARIGRGSGCLGWLGCEPENKQR